jgi:X-X-X-Leu-X-X-Gly heptad repeat protein
MKKILTLMLVFIMAFISVIPVTAAVGSSPKEEVVYGILGMDGSVDNLYVVNIFDGGVINDYGSYSKIINLSTSEKILQNNDQISISTKADKFYYQGNLISKDLPWSITVRYFLDGKEVTGADLAGRSGRLNIKMTVKQNNKIDNAFYNNYALQIGLLLDNRLCSDIKADNATIAEAGGKKQITYTVLPGNGIDIDVTAAVRDFEMEPITINGIKLSLGLNVDTNDFTEQISELTDAVIGLDDGAGELLQGLNKLSDGMQKYTDGMKAFKNGLGEFSDGAAMLNSGATAVSKGLSELSKQNAMLVNGSMSMQQAIFDSVNLQLIGMGLGLPVLTQDNYSKVLSPIPRLADVKKQLDSVVLFTQGLKGYTDGVAALGKGASDLAGGTAKLQTSSAVIAESANELYNAGAELNKGIKELREGLKEYKDGTKEFRDKTSGLSSEIDDKIDELIGGITGNGDKTVSFVSDKNTEVSDVMFVLKTASISIPENEIAVPEKSVKLNFWQKLLKLFGLYK